MGVHDFSKAPFVFSKYAKSLEENAEQIVREVAAAALGPFVRGTPADTNRAISNWQIGVGSPETEYLPTLSPGAIGGAGAGLVAALVVETGLARIKQWTLKSGDLYASNNAPYIMRLNDGSHSAQPGAFIEAGFQAALSRVKKLQWLKQL